MIQDSHCLSPSLGNPPKTNRLEGACFYRKLRSASQPALIRGSDDKLYIVKWNGSGPRPNALASEVVGNALFKAVRLPVPSWEPFFASEAFIAENPSMWPKSALRRFRVASGFHLASEFLGTERTGTLFEMLPFPWLGLLINPNDLLGAYMMDIWTGSSGPRNILFRAVDGTRRLQAFFVGNSDLFGGSDWQFVSSHGAALSYKSRLYADDWNAEAVSSWVTKIRMNVRETLDNLSSLVPECWRTGDVDGLAESLWVRLGSLESLAAHEFKSTGSAHLLP